MRKSILLLFTAITSLSSAIAAQEPLWLRYNSISPSASQIAFAYKGDIYVVDAKGGKAKQLTTADTYESNPVWSPDGSTIAFLSDRNGNFDIYTVSVDGGAPKRVTRNSTPETPLAFSKDGKSIIYSASMQKPSTNVQFASSWITELYSIPVDGGRPTQIVSNPVMNLSYEPNSDSFIYENRTGSENIWRKHHVSSVARNIFRYDAKTNTHQQLTKNVGEDRNPIITPQGDVLFLSERDGKSFNVYQAPITDMDNAKAVTNFKNHPVRFLSQAKDGTICYGYHGEIYTQAPNGKPQKVKVEIVNDLPAEQIKNISVGGGEVVVSEDGAQVFFASRGEIFATTEKYSTTKRITNTPEAERGITVAPDGRTIAYASQRGGIWNIYTAKIARDQEVNFANATLIDEQPLFENPKVERLDPQYSPDGKELAFVEDRNILKVINLETKKVRQISDGSQHLNNNDYGLTYQWSPDGKWFATEVVSNGRYPYSDIAIISASGDQKIHNITESGYIDGSPEWVLDGNAIIYASNRYGMRSHASWGSQDDIFIAFLNQDSYDKFRLSKEDYDLMKEEEKLAKKHEKAEADKVKKDDKNGDKKDEKADKDEEKEIEIDLKNLKERIVRLTPMSSQLSSAMLSKDGTKLYFLAAFEGGADLWETDLKSRSTKIIKKGAGYGSLSLSKDGKSLYQLGGRSYKMNLASKSSTPISTHSTMEFDAAKEREYMFDRVFIQQTKRFYNTNYHGVDLKKLREEYKDFLPYISNNYDFAEMLSEILGELNVSHTGSGYRGSYSSSSESTAELGLLYDLKYKGDGLKVAEVLKKGPFDTKHSKLAAGDIIEKINGVEILKDEDYYSLLNKKTGVKTLISIYNPSTKERWDEVIEPTSKGGVNSLMYRRWVESRAKETERLSGGRLGYVHIASMDDGSFRTIYNDILGKYNQYDGIVIDTRFNGGGRLHEDIEILFSGEKYLEQVVRGTEYGDMPSRRYNKPSIMLTAEANYSNAHGTPWVYQHQKIGKVVGMPVPGTMTSVNWETLQDPTLYFGIPVVGYRTEDGRYLENTQLEPDFKVFNQPNTLDEGRDEQLEVAVKELLKEIDSEPRWK